jgi:cytochrome c oxidase assembly factor CtaG/polyferredoxin
MPDVSNAIFASWSIPFAPTFALVLTALLYIRGWLKLRRLVPHRFEGWRLICFIGGLVALFVAISSPLDSFANLLLQVHMIQHLLFMMVVPPLLLLGNPFLPLLTGLPRPIAREGIGPFLAWPPIRRLGLWLTHPRTTWIIYVAFTVGWHLPAPYELTLHSNAWHEFEHACFLSSALLFWWPVVQPWPGRPQWPRWTMIPYLLFADIQNTALSAFLSFSDRVLYPTYEMVPHFAGMTALSDQNIAGAIMWVPGSIAYLVPAGVIAMGFLSPRRHRMYGAAVDRQTIRTGIHRSLPPRVRPALDLLANTALRRVLSSLWFRRTLQLAMFLIAMLIVLDGLFGPQVAPMNVAGVLPWTHWRGLTVLALLVAGNFFCFACPFTFVRDIGRRIFPARWNWPRWLRSKWLAGGLVLLYLWSYEAFSLWNSPWLTAWLVLGYFVAALLIDGFFRGASFCKYVCPIGQFHFVQSLVSPFAVKVRNQEVCRSCKTFDCVRGNEKQRGCELRLFQPKKESNLDCTFCLDCVRACPHDNVGIIATVPAKSLWTDRARSSIGRFARRTDLAFLVAVLVFGALSNAAGMALPVEDFLRYERLDFGLLGRPVELAIFFGLTVCVIPALLIAGCTWISHRLGSVANPRYEMANRFVMTLAPLGASIWLAHLGFHLFVGSHTFIPALQRLFTDFHFPIFGSPFWNIQSWALPELLDWEFLALDLGLLVTLYSMWRVARDIGQSSNRIFLIFLPWSILALGLFASAIWIIFQPMEMRGTLMAYLIRGLPGSEVLG